MLTSQCEVPDDRTFLNDRRLSGNLTAIVIELEFTLTVGESHQVPFPHCYPWCGSIVKINPVGTIGNMRHKFQFSLEPLHIHGESSWKKYVRPIVVLLGCLEPEGQGHSIGAQGHVVQAVAVLSSQADVGVINGARIRKKYCITKLPLFNGWSWKYQGEILISLVRFLYLFINEKLSNNSWKNTANSYNEIYLAYLLNACQEMIGYNKGSHDSL